MNETVDRVARAICKARFMDSGTGDDGWADCSPEMENDYRRQARVILNEMITILYEWGEDQAAAVMRDRARS